MEALIAIKDQFTDPLPEIEEHRHVIEKKPRGAPRGNNWAETDVLRRAMLEILNKVSPDTMDRTIRRLTRLLKVVYAAPHARKPLLDICITLVKRGALGGATYCGCYARALRAVIRECPGVHRVIIDATEMMYHTWMDTKELVNWAEFMGHLGRAGVVSMSHMGAILEMLRGCHLESYIKLLGMVRTRFPGEVPCAETILSGLSGRLKYLMMDALGK